MPAAESLTEFHNEKTIPSRSERLSDRVAEGHGSPGCRNSPSHRHPYQCMLLRQCTLLRPFSDDGHGETIEKRSVRS